MGQRAEADSFRFELVPDEGQGHDPDDGPLPDAEPAPPTFLERVRAWPRRRVVAGLVVAAVVVAAGGVASTVVERQRVAALRTAPGGVADLGDPPATGWSVDVLNGTPLTVLGGMVVVMGYSQESDSTPGDSGGVSDVQLRAIDPADGSEAWRRSYVGNWNCGPTPNYTMSRLVLATTDSLVCVGESENPTVQVIDAAGDVVAERKLEGDDVRVPAAEGGLLRLEHVGEAGPLPEVIGDETSGYRLDGPVIAPDMHLTMEDAATGTVRWETTVESLPTGPDNWYQCVTWGEDGTGEPEITPTSGGFYNWANDSLVVVGACGVDAAFTPSGNRLDVPSGTPDDESSFDGMGGYEMVMRSVDGYYARPAEVDQYGRYNQSSQAPWDVIDAEGTVLRSLPGQVAEPWATDGSHPKIVISNTEGGLAAFRMSDGEKLWGDAFVSPTGVLVRTRDLALLVTGDRELVALDLESGERRWTAELDAEDPMMWGDAAGIVRAAFTDGRVAVVVTPGMGVPGPPTWTAYDLGSGEVVWTWETELGGDSFGFTVDGRMLNWDYQTLTGLG